MFDASIISACVADAKSYHTIKSHVDVEEFTPIGAFWFKQIESWYKRDPGASAIDLNILRERGMREAGRNSEPAGEFLVDLPPAPSPANVGWELLELKRTIKYRELAGAIEGEWDREQIMELTQEHYDLMRATELRSEVVFSDISTLALRDPDNLIPLAPEKLNERTGGGAEPGTHIVLFARVEAGKTAAAVNMTARWLKAGKKVLYLGNEEPVERIANRVRCNLSGMNPSECSQYESEMWERVHNKGWNNLRMAQLYPGSPEEVEDYVESYRPDCLVIDQLRNLHPSTSGKGTRAQSLDRVASAIRQITTKHQLVTLSLGQANAGEHGKPRIWFETDDFDESRTGVPASADLMIGLGFDHTLDAHNQRAVSLCKNKLTGDHEGFVITLDKQRSTLR